MTATVQPLNILLIANNQHRIQMLKQMMGHLGITCRLRLVEQSKIAGACLRRVKPYEKQTVPDLVMYDLAEPSAQSVSVVKDIAFGERRSTAPVVLLTSPASEPMLDSGEIDEGEAIMLSPRSLEPFLKKLIGDKRENLLRAARIFYQYGPILIRQPDNFLDRHDEVGRLSA